MISLCRKLARLDKKGIRYDSNQGVIYWKWDKVINDRDVNYLRKHYNYKIQLEIQ